MYCHATLTADNVRHDMGELVRRIVNYIDCMIEEVARIEDYWGIYERGSCWEVTDRFAFVIDGARTQISVPELAQGDSAQPGDAYRHRLSMQDLEAKRAAWRAARERLTRVDRLEIEHIYMEERQAEWMMKDGLPGLLDDLMGAGRLADRATLRVTVDPDGDFHDGDLESEDGLPKRYFWMNGMLRGEYVHGEVPFVRDDRLIRSIGSWQQSFDIWDQEWGEGFRLKLAPDTDPALLARAKACALKFKEKLDCGLVYTLSHQDHYWDDREPHEYRPTNEQEVRLWLAYFAKLRERFSDEEARQMCAGALPLQEMLLRHAEGKYTPEEIELYRFGIAALVLLNKLRQERHSEGIIQPEALREKLAALPEELESGPKGMDGNKVLLIGMGDLSRDEARFVNEILYSGLYVEIRDIRLNGLDEIYVLEELLNELAEIEREARAKDGGAPRPALGDEENALRPLVELTECGDALQVNAGLSGSEGMDLLDENSNVVGSKPYKYMTNREFYTFMQRGGV